MVEANNENGVSVGPGIAEPAADDTNGNAEKVKGIGSAENDAVDPDNGPDNGDDDNDNDEGYDEEQDEDYVADAAGKGKASDASDGANGDDDGDDDEEFIDEDDKKEIAKYSSIESSEGGLIKTRRQRLEEEAKEKKEKKNRHVHSNAGVGDSSPAKVDINSIWAELNSTSKSVPTTAASQVVSSSTTITGAPGSTARLVDEKVKITRTYEFAGKRISEEKWVDANSEEAKAYLNSAAIPAAKSAPAQTASEPMPASTAVPQKNLRRKRKRASLLDAVITNSSNTKLTTLEKSRLDWATYVDKNKIGDELKYTNKAGFLEKQDFLSRVDSRRDNLYSKAKSKVSKDN
ncbi:hypothetical protein PMKS-001151 [Pichia membranifaciens]|uniref:SWR1-complex protein 5 n=1 Tax=Pichia membranifaciens TaxID=4926 RepID=A0A1Q2YE66_9ASCO|nr:hypothetical protein PMKS-001151 [Pichia membranifaciens]